jgi:hypothetical protein
MGIGEFVENYLELLKKGQAFEVYGLAKLGLSKYIDELELGKEQAVNVIVQRAEREVLREPQCVKVKGYEHLWELRTRLGVRFVYFRDGARIIVIVYASKKSKKNKFQDSDLHAAEQARIAYFKEKARY